MIQPLRVIERLPPAPGRVRDRATWPPGEWDNEPDLIEWRDADTGYPCLIVRGPVGSLCGYVGVPEGHPAHGKNYNEVDGRVPAHGGLTYSDTCVGHICHVPQPGESDTVWWLGFDCAHSGDVSPGMIRHYLESTRRMGLLEADAKILEEYHRRDEYRTVAYVQAECGALAAALSALADQGPLAATDDPGHVDE